jgi:hypothetical protein
VRRVNRHAGESRLFEIEDTRPCELRGKIDHRFTRRIVPACSRARR